MASKDVTPRLAREIQDRIANIKANIHNMQNARAEIIKDLIFLSENKKALKATTGKTFDELVKEWTGLSRRYLNQLVSNYKFLERYGRLELFDTVDVKAIEHAKKHDRPEILDAPGGQRRPKTGDRLPILDAEVIPGHPIKPFQSAQEGPHGAVLKLDGGQASPYESLMKAQEIIDRVSTTKSGRALVRVWLEKNLKRIT